MEVEVLVEYGIVEKVFIFVIVSIKWYFGIVGLFVVWLKEKF